MIKRIGKINIGIFLILSSIWAVILFLDINSEIKLQNYTKVGDSKYLNKKININKNSFSIDFNFYINNLKNEPEIIKYENIFQTANYNDGIRVEFSRLAGNESRWALVYTDKQNKMQGVDLGALPLKEKWHTVKIRYKAKRDQLIIYINNNLIKSVENSNIKLNFEHVVVGHGFNKDRVFDGKVSDFRVFNSKFFGYEVLNKPIESEIYRLLYLLTFLLFLIILRKQFISLNYYIKGVSKKIGLDLYITNINIKYAPKNKPLKYLLFLLILLFALFHAVQYSNQITLDDYTDINEPIRLNAPLKIDNDTSIELDFYIDPLLNKVEVIQYENLFQTADINSGFRVELGRKTESASQWALVYTNTNGGLEAVTLGTIPSESQWHTMRVSYLKDKNRIDVFLNGIYIKNHDDANVALDFSNVISGQAFYDRKFHGKIKNFTIQKRLMPLYVFIVLSVLSVLSILILIINGAKEHHIVANTYSNMTIFKKSSLLIFLLAIFSIFILYAESYLVKENDVFRVIIALLSVFSFIILIIFFHNIQNAVLRRSSLVVLYMAFCSFLSLYFTSAMYMLGKLSDQVKRPYGLSIDETAAIYQSSFAESIQFVITSLGYSHLIIIFIVPPVLTIILYFSVRYFHPIKNHKLTLSCALVVIASIYIILPSIPTFPKAIYAGFMKYSQHVETMKKFSALRKEVNLDLTLNNDMKGTHILVMGESVNKNHMGAYGYFRKNTPWLTKQKRNNNFIFFQNTYAPYSHTVPSLLKIMTAASQYNQARQFEAISIIDIAKKAGFKTHWISEHPFTETDTPLSVIINEADEIKYVDEGGHIINALDRTMEKLDRTKNNLIILHLIGSHAGYKHRIIGYKDGFTDTKIGEVGSYSQDKHKRFMSEILNPYDSTIKYTDGILKKIFELTAKKHSFVDSFIYSADHGEDVFGEKFHNSADFSYPMVRIPFVIYFSKRYKEQFKDDFYVLRSRRNDIFTTDLLYNTMLDIFKLESENFEDGYSLLAANYKINESNAITMQHSPDEDTTYYSLTNKVYIKNDPLYIAKKNIEYLNKNYPNRFIANHSESLLKISESSMLGFKGLEFNIVLEGFVIGHPPEYMLNVPIEKYLSYTEIMNKNKLWFDIKSKAGENIEYSFEAFEFLNKKYNIKKRSLLESTENGLGLFSKNGWDISYYLKPYSYPECKKMDDACAEIIVSKIEDSGANSISFPYNYYLFIKNKVEPSINNNISYHTFGMPKMYSIFSNQLINNFEKLDIVSDDRVKTILLDPSEIFEY